MVVEVAEKKEFCSYYTNNDTILKYMIKQIDVDGVKILEPCGGGGAFIDAILDFNKSAIIDTLDCNPDAANNLKKKYKNFSKVKVWQGDTLFDTTLDQNSNSYDSIIGNPPYGVWQDNDRRIKLKKKYPNCYVKESYTMFLIRCLSLLKNNGKLCFIIPDTFLYLHRHEKLRKMLLRMTIIDSILIFPSKLFPEVNFGYAKLSIISLKKSNNYDFNLSNKVKIYNQVNNERDIDGIINKNNDKYILKTQSEILDNASSAFEFSSNGLNVEKLKEIENVISDFANCVTGIYTGNNIKYIKRLNDRVKNSKGYENINSNDNNYIPLIKGTSNTRYISTDNWFIDWSDEAIYHYKNDKKARFQNSEYYFKRGIAFPMVKSNNSKAIVMDNKVFDQSVIGVFPKEEKYFNYLLAFMNTDLFIKIINLINPSANSSANYIKKVPLKMPNEKQLDFINDKVDSILFNETNIEEIQKELNFKFLEIFKFL